MNLPPIPAPAMTTAYGGTLAIDDAVGVVVQSTELAWRFLDDVRIDAIATEIGLRALDPCRAEVWALGSDALRAMVPPELLPLLMANLRKAKDDVPSALAQGCRLVGLAEKAWTQVPSTDWSEYAARLGRQSVAWQRRDWVWFRAAEIDWARPGLDRRAAHEVGTVGGTREQGENP